MFRDFLAIFLYKFFESKIVTVPKYPLLDSLDRTLVFQAGTTKNVSLSDYGASTN